MRDLISDVFRKVFRYHGYLWWARKDSNLHACQDCLRLTGMIEGATLLDRTEVSFYQSRRQHPGRPGCRVCRSFATDPGEQTTGTPHPAPSNFSRTPPQESFRSIPGRTLV
jgi:hypothetical protein